MSSLPFLSHHLFVAAVAHEDPDSRQSSSHSAASLVCPGDAIEVPLELLEAAKPLPAGGTRPLRVSVALGGS